MLFEGDVKQGTPFPSNIALEFEWKMNTRRDVLSHNASSTASNEDLTQELHLMTNQLLTRPHSNIDFMIDSLKGESCNIV
jgi:hypothetical protein